LGTAIFTFRLILFLIKVSLLSIYKYKHTLSPRTNENTGQQCNLKILQMFSKWCKIS